MSRSSPKMRIAYAAEFIGLTLFMACAAYLTFIGYSLHREATLPGQSLWHWSPAAQIFLIGVALFHLGIWRLLHTLHHLRHIHAASPPDERIA